MGYRYSRLGSGRGARYFPIVGPRFTGYLEKIIDNAPPICATPHPAPKREKCIIVIAISPDRLSGSKRRPIMGYPYSRLLVGERGPVISNARPIIRGRYWGNHGDPAANLDDPPPGAYSRIRMPHFYRIGPSGYPDVKDPDNWISLVAIRVREEGDIFPIDRSVIDGRS